MEIVLSPGFCHHYGSAVEILSVKMCGQIDKQKGKVARKEKQRKDFCSVCAVLRGFTSILLHQTKTNSRLRIEGLLLAGGNVALL